MKINYEETILENKNCSSYHYLAIAYANFKRYHQLLLEGRDENDYGVYLNTWMEAEKLAQQHKKEEMNIKVNENWNRCKMNDGRKLWKAIDWKGKSINEKKEEIPPDVIHTYFKGIFQSTKTKDNPTLKVDEVYVCEFVDELDVDITIEEVNKAMKEIGTGTSIDGIALDILQIIPPSVRQLIHQLCNKVFNSTYPTAWQLLLPHPKKGHKPADPQLRGIAINICHIPADGTVESYWK